MPAYYWKSSEGVLGPYSVDELRFLAERKKLSPGDEVRMEGKAEWMAARNVSGLFKPRGSARPQPATPPVRARHRPKSEGAGSEMHDPASDAASAPASVTAPDLSESPQSVRRPVPPSLASLSGGPSRRKKWAIATAAVAAMAALLILLLVFVSGLSGLDGSEGAEQSDETGPELVAGAPQAVVTEQQPAGAGTTGQADDAAEDQPPPAPDSGDSQVKPDPPSQTDSGSTAAADSASRNQPADAAANSATSSRFLIGSGEFFGIVADGSTFVYVVDCSGSMSGAPFDAARRELTRSIRKLLPDQRFYVIFFSSHAYPMFSPGASAAQALPADDQSVRRVTDWIDRFPVKGGTNPEPAMLLALRLQPDAVFLLTDGDFKPDVVDSITSANNGRASIHTIAFRDRSGEPLLKRIAEGNRGVCRFVP